jgi:hypothetical protein
MMKMLVFQVHVVFDQKTQILCVPCGRTQAEHVDAVREVTGFIKGKGKVSQKAVVAPI